MEKRLSQKLKIQNRKSKELREKCALKQRLVLQRQAVKSNNDIMNNFKRAYSLLTCFELLISGGLLGLSIFEWVNKPNLKAKVQTVL